MSEEGDFWKEYREERKKERRRLGINCPGCNIKEPKRTPTILMPGQRCRVCGYKDPRKE
jgi:hypothetical protein